MGVKDHIADTNASLLKAEKDYFRNRPKKWVVLSLFLILGGITGYAVPELTLILGASKFSRSSLDNIMYNLLGHRHFPAVVTNELLTISYEYNS